MKLRLASEFTILLPQPPVHWDCRCVLPWPNVYLVFDIPAATVLVLGNNDFSKILIS
jgi:hypothetical protein